MRLPTDAREATIEMVVGVAGSHVVASVLLVANMVQAQVLAERSTLGEFVAVATTYPVEFASIAFGPHLEANMTPTWAATVIGAYAVGLVMSVWAFRVGRMVREDLRVPDDEVDLEEFATDGGRP